MNCYKINIHIYHIRFHIIFSLATLYTWDKNILIKKISPDIRTLKKKSLSKIKK